MKTRTKLIEVRESDIHGKGVFARTHIPAGVRLTEYTGTKRRWSCLGEDDGYACLFDVGRGLVIDPRENGNLARFINHSCTPNCESVLDDGRIYIESVREIRPGEEITYDYSLILGYSPSRADRQNYVCRCNSPGCRGTLIKRTVRGS